MSDPGTKRICDRCIEESYLKALVVSNGTAAVCSYCDEESKSFTVEELAVLIEKAFEEHYKRTPTDPEGFEAAMHFDREGDFEWERNGEPVLWAIANAAGIDEEAAADIISLLQDRHSDREAAKMGDECEFDPDSHYEEKATDCEEFAQRWFKFENGLKTEARFFSRSGQAALDEIFADLTTLQTNKGDPVVVTAGPTGQIKSLHRARVFAEEGDKLEETLKYPWIHLGPPPMHAASAGRMNARGISVFYGAIDADTALAEVRPPVGSKVAVAKFIVQRPLKLLDVKGFKSVAARGSIFDPEFLRRTQRAKFLEILSGRISHPVMRNEEALEYLPTQAVADYLATEAKLDGIIFPSVQVGHTSSNVVLFHHASRVVEVELPKGTEIEAYLEQYDSEGASPDYRVFEEVLSASAAAAPSKPEPFDLLYRPTNLEPSDDRSPSLKIDLDSVVVHHITAVEFRAEAYPVVRRRMTKPHSPI